MRSPEVGSKFRGRHLRVVMVVIAGLVFVIGAGAMVSLPQSFAF